MTRYAVYVNIGQVLPTGVLLGYVDARDANHAAIIAKERHKYERSVTLVALC